MATFGLHPNVPQKLAINFLLQNLGTPKLTNYHLQIQNVLRCLHRKDLLVLKKFSINVQNTFTFDKISPEINRLTKCDDLLAEIIFTLGGEGI